MVRARKLWAAKNHTIFIWLSSGILFLFLFKMASRNMATDNLNPNIPAEPILDYSKQRTDLYENMSRDLYEQGAAFLAKGETSQSLSLSDLFTLKNGKVTPVLKAADPPVRASVLYLSPKFSEPIAQTVKKVFLPDFGTAIWFQNASLYHFSMFHASHHIEPVLATAEEVDSEARAVEAVSRKICPLRIKLERVVLTSTGVLLGCWQVSLEKVIQRSFLVSADMAHCLHPNYMDRHEESHQPKMHKGLVIKHNANQRYATNAVTSFIFREIGKIHKLPIQDFVVRNDMPCGSTIGPILASGVGIRTVDIGAPQLSMHSIREMCGVDDVVHSYQHLKAYFEEFSKLDSQIKVDC